MVGEVLGRYRIVEEIGAGGMGVVFRARDERLGRDLALKVLSPGVLHDEVSRKRFRNEALMLSRLNHPSIQVIHDFDTQDGVKPSVTGENMSRTLYFCAPQNTKLLEPQNSPGPCRSYVDAH
jgi:serine/threonine protein kinase